MTSRPPPILFLLLVVTLVPGVARAAPVVFASDGSAVNPGVPLDLTEGSSSEPAHLFVEFGTAQSTGTPCIEDVSADGDEVCGFDVEIELTGDLYIVGFAAEPGVEFEPQPPFDPSSKLLRAVGVMAINPADPSLQAQKIGVLQVDTTGANGGTLDVRAGAAVRADLEMMSLSSEIVATTNVPEPGRVLLLVSGVAALLLLHRRRLRRRDLAV